MSYYCYLCKKFDEKLDARTHRCASNTASNVANNATNTVLLPQVESVLPVLDSKRKQRWSREAYNAYQKEYMRRRRATTA